MEELEVIVHSDFNSLDVIRASMGRWHHQFARSVGGLGGLVLDLVISGRVVGQSVVYTLDLGSGVFGVVYYIAVLPQYRGRGLGKILLASSEEVLADMSSEYLMATISEDNISSMKLFGSMGYQLYRWDHIAGECGWKAAELIRMATCGYEDDIAAVKSANGPPALPDLCSVDGKRARRWWRSACLKPWLDLRGRAKS